jgi:hypothetical protein
MFGNAKGKPANLNNTLNKANSASAESLRDMRKAKPDHIAASISHQFERDDNLPMWHGLHAFRRGLATILYGLE